MTIWRVNAAIPGLNIPFFIEAAEKPTFEQINAVWMKLPGATTPLKDPATLRNAPLRDCYPSYAGVEPIEVHTIPEGTS